MLLGIALALVPHAAQPSEPTTVDLAVRYVNEQIISAGDVRLHVQIQVDDYQRKGKPLPSTRAEMLSFWKESLESLTDEELLIQYGKEISEKMKVQLVDEERISQMVLERARSTGRNMTLREQAQQRRFIERRQMIDAVIGFFDSKTAHISPAELNDYYQNKQQDYYRPARMKVFEIILRASSNEERAEVRKAATAIFRRAQDVTDAAIKKAVESRLDAYAVASVEDQAHLLAETMNEIASAAERTDLDQDSLQVARDAVQVKIRFDQVRTVNDARAALEKIRAEVDGKGSDAFKALAQRLSQGPNATDGGDLGWVEPGTYAGSFDQVVFALKAGELSQVFQSDQMAGLVLVSERQDAKSRPFSEVTGEIEQVLQRVQDDMIRSRAVAMLRKKASIKDLVDVETMME